MLWRDLIALNKLQDPFVLRVGQRLRLTPTLRPAPQTLEQRARAFEITIDDVMTGGQPAAMARASERLLTWVTERPTDGLAWQTLATLYRAQNQGLRAVRADAEAQVALLDAQGHGPLHQRRRGQRAEQFGVQQALHQRLWRHQKTHAVDFHPELTHLHG